MKNSVLTRKKIESLFFIVNKIGLQFPDELLYNSINVCARLKSKFKEAAPVFFILADTSFGRQNNTKIIFLLYFVLVKLNVKFFSL
jgi:hypothetical protein